MTSSLRETVVHSLTYLVAFGVAWIVVIVELLSSEYPRTYFALTKSKSLALYAAFYGLLAVIALFLFATVVDIRLANGVALMSPWVTAAICGASIKSVLQLNIATIRIGSERIPIGLKTLVQLFEPPLLRSIAFQEFLGVRALVSKFVTADRVIGEVKRAATDGIPPSLPKAEREGFSADVELSTSVERVMTLYLRFAGREAFTRVFGRSEQ
jgi:hypothetical protein